MNNQRQNLLYMRFLNIVVEKEKKQIIPVKLKTIILREYFTFVSDYCHINDGYVHGFLQKKELLRNKH